MSNIEKFIALLSAASAISIDHGPLLTEWDSTAITGHPENEVVRFSWTDGEYDFAEIFDEGGIEDGVFDDNGRFVVENIEGEKSEIRFFETFRLVQPFTGHKAAEQFFQELLGSVDSLMGIADRFGAQTLADLFALQNAIQDDSFIETLPGSSVLEIINLLPSASAWRDRISTNLTKGE